MFVFLWLSVLQYSTRIVREKNLVDIMEQSFTYVSIVGTLWVLFNSNLAFGKYINGTIGLSDFFIYGGIKVFQKFINCNQQYIY